MSIKDFFAKWFLAIRETRLRNRLIEKKDTPSLNIFLAFVIEYGQPFPIHDSKIRAALFSVDSWKAEDKYQDQLFSSVESYLFDSTQPTEAVEWHVWLREHRKLGRRVDVVNPTISKALLNAHHTKKLSGLPKEDQDYLLNCYWQTYGEILEAAQPEDQTEMLPVLVEFATIAHLLDHEKASLRTLKRWAAHPLSRPRALVAMGDTHAYHAPIRGMGSPHGISVTFYHDPLSNLPIRVTCAGATGDATLNSQVFTSLFATALACDSEPTFITSSGCILSLDTEKSVTTKQQPGALLAAVIGPAGPVQPAPGTPSLGMDADEATMLVADTFQRLQESTGLVKVMRWDIDDVNQLENRVTQTLELTDQRSHLIKSSPHWSEGATLVHIMPLLHRNAQGQAVPIEIEIPYRLLGPQRVFSILRTARQAYMQQLIAAGQRRKVMAEQAYKEQDEQVRHWQSLSPEQQAAICTHDPSVTITQMYNFELGIITPIDPPEQVARRDYEEYQRPQIRNHAKLYAERFAALCHKLEDLNRDGGKADLLTFKLLLDSMLRQSPLAIAHTAFQNEYTNWVNFSSIPVWAAIVEWARQRGLSSETLAADNILYNAKLQANQKSILIQPWVIIDPHDFVIHIDCQRGLMYVFPGGKTPTLIESLISDPDNRITNPKELHDQFCTWVTNNLRLQDQTKRQKAETAVQAKILNDPIVGTIVQMETAKHLLFKGDAPRAIKLIQTIRHADLAPIYCWGAVAHQYQYLEKHATEFGLDLSGLDRDKRANRLVNASFSTLIESLKPSSPNLFDASQVQALMRSGRHSEADLRTLLISGQRRSSVPIAQEAQTYLNQLQACDSSFVDGLLREQPNVHQLESSSLHLSPDSETRVRAAILALSSLEFLHLAETMKNTAKELPFTGRWTQDLRKEMDKLLEQMRSLTYRESSVSSQIEDLAKML